MERYTAAPTEGLAAVDAASYLLCVRQDFERAEEALKVANMVAPEDPVVRARSRLAVALLVSPISFAPPHLFPDAVLKSGVRIHCDCKAGRGG